MSDNINCTNCKYSCEKKIDYSNALVCRMLPQHPLIESTLKQSTGYSDTTEHKVKYEPVKVHPNYYCDYFERREDVK